MEMTTKHLDHNTSEIKFQLFILVPVIVRSYITTEAVSKFEITWHQLYW